MKSNLNQVHDPPLFVDLKKILWCFQKKKKSKVKRVVPEQTEEALVKEALALGQETLTHGQEPLALGEEFPHLVQHKRRRRRRKVQVETEECSQVRTEFPFCVINRLLTHTGHSPSS